jgi:hypothetical protein
MENCDGQSLIAQASFSGVTDDCAGQLCFVDVSISSPSTVVAGGAVVLVHRSPSHWARA